MIDKIVGIIFLPLSIILFLNVFGITQMDSIIGIDILLIAAIALIIIQAANVMGAHWAKEHVKKSYFLCAVAAFPSIIYFAFLGALPEALFAPMQAIFASFIFVEGIYGFYF